MALHEFWDLAKGGGSGASRQDFGVSKLNLYGLYWDNGRGNGNYST